MSSSRQVPQRAIHGPLDECYTCGARFLYHEQLVQHMNDEAHWPTCEICGEQFRRGSQLESHLENKHHFWCKECGRTFATQRGLIDHMNALEHRGPIHKCRTCNEMFSAVTRRDRHERDQRH
ncbi:hypothetical protein HDV63DRAFT_409454 [Trichoderma sp. SZMC 28014]